MDWYAPMPPVFTGRLWFTCGHDAVAAFPWLTLALFPRSLTCFFCAEERELAAFQPHRPKDQAAYVNTY